MRSGDGGRDGGERVVDGAVPLAKRLPRRPGRVPRVGPEKVPSHEPREKVRELLPGVRVERVEDTELPELKNDGKESRSLLRSLRRLLDYHGDSGLGKTRSNRRNEEPASSD